MIKAIAIIRTSTKRQEIAAQKAETLEYAKSYGYAEDEILVVGKQGASAIKLDDAYKENLDRVYQALEEYQIECVFAWGLDRIGRNELVLISLKTKLIEKGIQLRIKNPTLFLFDENGKVNSGMDIAINMFIAMSRQEMETKQVRFKRAKEDNSKNGKFNGGKGVKYGYTVDSNNYVVKNDDEAENVIEMYKLYSTGKYSIKALTELINARGINLSQKNVTDILSNTCYKGYTNYTDNRRSKRVYPIIVSDELWDAARIVREQNNLNISKTRRIFLGTKLVKCPVCKHNYVVNGGIYTCINYMTRNKCDNHIGINQVNLDKLLLYVALPEHKIYCSTDKQARINRLSQELNDVKLKIILKDKQFNSDEDDSINAKINRLNELYVGGKMSSKQYSLLSDKIDEEAKELNNQISQLRQEQLNLEHTIAQLTSTNNKENMFGELTLKEMFNITHDYITKVTITRKNPEDKKVLLIQVEYKAFAYDEFEDRCRIFEYYPYSKKNKFNENDEYVDDSISKILGNLADIIEKGS